VSSNSLFPRKSDIFKKSMIDARETVGRASLDTIFQVTFSFGNWQKWLDNDTGASFPTASTSGDKRSQGANFMQKMAIMCTEAELPGTSFQTSLAVGHHQGIQEEFPNLRQFPPLNLSFYVDADHVIIEVLEKWMTYINPISTNKRKLNAFGRFNYPEDYKEIIHITKFERDAFIDDIEKENNKQQGTLDSLPEFRRKPTTKLMSYEFVNVWPTNLTSMRLAYGDSNVLKCSVQFSYDRFFTTFNYEQTNQAIDDFTRATEDERYESPKVVNTTKENKENKNKKNWWQRARDRYTGPGELDFTTM